MIRLMAFIVAGMLSLAGITSSAQAQDRVNFNLSIGSPAYYAPRGGYQERVVVVAPPPRAVQQPGWYYVQRPTGHVEYVQQQWLYTSPQPVTRVYETRSTSSVSTWCPRGNIWSAMDRGCVPNAQVGYVQSRNVRTQSQPIYSTSVQLPSPAEAVSNRAVMSRVFGN